MCFFVCVQAQLLTEGGVESVTLHFHKGQVFTGGSDRGLQFLKEHPVAELLFTAYFFESNGPVGSILVL